MIALLMLSLCASPTQELEALPKFLEHVRESAHVSPERLAAIKRVNGVARRRVRRELPTSDEFRLDQVGRLQSETFVVGGVRDGAILVRATEHKIDFMLVGMNVRDVVTGRRVYYSGPLHVFGTQEVTTARGAVTVHVLAPFDESSLSAR